MLWFGLRLGTRCRRFESCHLDQKPLIEGRFFHFYFQWFFFHKLEVLAFVIEQVFKPALLFCLNLILLNVF